MSRATKYAQRKFSILAELNRQADDKDLAMDKRLAAKTAKRKAAEWETRLNGADRETYAAVNKPSQSAGDFYRGKKGTQRPVKGKEKRRHRLACSKA